jgi:hypothetical protein
MENNNLDEVSESETVMMVTEDPVPTEAASHIETAVIIPPSETIEPTHEATLVEVNLNETNSNTNVIASVDVNNNVNADDSDKMDTTEAKLDTEEQSINPAINPPQETEQNQDTTEDNLKPSEDLDENEDDLIKEINEFGDIGDLNEPFGDSFPAISGDANNGAISSHTFRKTEWDVKKLENHVRLTYGDETLTENMPPSQLNTYLKSFFEFAKKSDGMEYEPESLIGFMNSFERYLKTKNYPESLLRSDSFKEARTFLKKKRELVRSIGRLIRTKTNDTFYILQYHRNLLKEKNLLNRDNPDCLLAEVFLV